MIRVLIVDDHELIREGVKKIIRSSGDMEVIAESGSFSEAVEATIGSRPDVILLDMDLPDRDGVSGIEEWRRRFPAIPVVVLSMYPEERFAVRALKAGAASYISKSMAAEELVRAVRSVMVKGIYITPELANLLARNVRHPQDKHGPDRLTPRETQVLALIGAGMQPKEIAAELGISLSSVNTYRARIFAKLDVSNDRQLIRYALENGLAQAERPPIQRH